MANTSIVSQIFESSSHSNNNTSINNNLHEVSREEIQAAIAKAVELRALHAALMQGNSPSHLNYQCTTSPVSYPIVPQPSAQDYPVFTPSYEDAALPEYHQSRTESLPFSGYWDDCGIKGGDSFETISSNFRKESISSKKENPYGFVGVDSHTIIPEDQKSVNASYANQITVLQTQTSPKFEFFKSSGRNSLGDFKSESSSSCNKYRPAIKGNEIYNTANSSKSSNVIVPLTDSQASVKSHPKNKGMNLSWLLLRFKKKQKNVYSPARTEPEEVSKIFNDFGILSLETLKKELMKANENRDAALIEVSDLRSSMEELKQKFEYLECYCEELKMALRQAAHMKDEQVHDKRIDRIRSEKSVKGKLENLMPVSEEVMVEGFLQIVSEARVSVKHFCKILMEQIEQSDSTLMENLNMLLQPHKLSLDSKYSKAVMYHLEAIINEQLHQDFENCIFQKNGSPKILDPQQDRQAQFSSFVALRNLSWNEVLRKGTKFYSEEFSKFCDEKMSCIILTLKWTKPWPEQLLQAFFVAAKCIWLLHLLAFSFNPPLGILRLEENNSFDSNYMEDVFMDRHRLHCPSRVKIMVMPGFYVLDRVLKCKVLCRYKSVA